MRRVCSVAVFLFLTAGVVPAVAQNKPPLALCQAMREFNPAMCLTETTLDDPLADRIPVILIHGWNKDEIPGKPDATVWAGLRRYLDKNEEFNKYYKIYFLLYLSNVQGVRDMGLTFGDLINQMDQADSSFRGKPLVIVGYSMGGLVARSYMQEPRLRYGSELGGDRVLRLITLGTPHHGTPLANGPARDHKAGALASYLFDIIDYGLFNSSLTWSTDNRFDLHWDNYDKLFDYDRDRENNLWLEWLNSGETFDRKIVAYGGTVEPITQIKDCVFSGFRDAGCLAGIMKNNLGISQSDGVVPLNSALFFPCTECVATRTYKGYDHGEIVRGKFHFFEEPEPLFKDIASDLLTLVVPSVSKLK